MKEQKSEFNSFFTGSLETLNKKDLRQKMLEFYKKYYVPENVSLCVISNYDINKMKKMVITNFENFTNNKITPKIELLKPFYKKNINKTFIIKSDNKTFQLKYIFETHELNKYNKTKIFNYVSFLINLDMKNTLKDFLLFNNYITTVISDFEISTGLFNIHFDLTKKGEKNINLIDGYLRYYIDFIIKFNKKDLFNIINKIDIFNYNNLSKEDPIELGQMLVTNTFLYDIKNIFNGNYLFLDYNETHFKDLEKFLNFKNCIQLIITNKFKITNHLVDPYYGTKYSEIKKIIGKPENFNISLDFKNNYISKLLFNKNLHQEQPIEYSKNLWFGHTSKFNEKKCYINILFYDNNFFSSVKNYIFTNISLIIINELLNREFCLPILLDYNFNFIVNQKYNQIILEINTHNDEIIAQKFINDILNFIINKKLIDINKDYIKQKFLNFKNNIKNISKMSPWDYCDYINNLNFKNNYSEKNIFNELHKINLIDFNKYFIGFLKKSNCVILTYGNIKKPFNFDLIKNNLSNNYKFNDFNLTKNIIIKHPNKKEKDSCINYLTKVGILNDELFLNLHVATTIIHEFFYNKLRTDKQLGYLIRSNWIKINNNYYIYQKIQSRFEYKVLYSNIKEFNLNILNYLDDKIIENTISSLKEKLKTKENNIYEISDKYVNEIIKREFRFNRKQELLNKIKNITKKSVEKFIEKYIINNKNIYIIFIEKN